MQIRLTLKPGQKGTKRLVTEYGDRLVCVRYRYDAQTQKRYKTIELIVDERAWTPRYRPKTVVAVRVKFEEVGLRRRVRQAGGRWNREKQVWEMCYEQVAALELVDRIVGVADLQPDI